MIARLQNRPFVLSIAVHLLLILALAWLAAHPLTPPVSKKTTLWIEVTPTQHPKDERSRQVVQSFEGEKVAQAEKNAFLGKENLKVDRETSAKQQSLVSNPGRPKKATEQKQAQINPQVTNPSIGLARGPLSKFGLPILPAQRQAPKNQPNWTDYSQTFGEVPKDYVTGLKESEQTALNTREFVYYSYFQRIRIQLDRAWQNILRENLVKLYKSGRSIATDMDHTTRTYVTLDGKGEVIRVQLLEESGVRDLDDAAVKAFNQAGPFPNPPKDLVDGTGQIQIQWDFILKT